VATSARDAFRCAAETHALPLAPLATLAPPLALRWSRACSGTPACITISPATAGRSFASFLVQEAIGELPAVDAPVGRDGGQHDLAMLRTGEPRATPRHAPLRATGGAAHAAAPTRRTAAAASRRARRSGRHTLTTRRIRVNQAAGVASLALQKLARQHARAKASGAVGGSARGRHLASEAAWYRCPGVAIDRWSPSATRCQAGGPVRAAMPLAVRRWTGPACDRRHDRDDNAARTLLAAGGTGHAGGAVVRPGRAWPIPACPAEAAIPRR
jgi:putative transposase